MIMCDLFEKYKAKTLVIDKITLNKLQYKNYENGEPIKIGDNVLTVLYQYKQSQNLLMCKIIFLKKEHIEEYSKTHSIIERADFVIIEQNTVKEHIEEYSKNNSIMEHVQNLEQ